MSGYSIALPAAPRSIRHPNRLAGLLLVAAAVAAFTAQTPLRSVEAMGTAAVVDVFTTGHAHSSGDIVFFGLGTPEVHGLVITSLCSTVVLVAPLLAIAGVVLLFGLRPRRVALGLLGALALAAGSNLARYVGAAVALQRFGMSGFDLVHEYLGSLLVIFGFAAAIVLLLWVSTRDRGHGRRAGSARSGRHGSHRGGRSAR